MKVWIEFYEGQPEEHENVYSIDRQHEEYGFLMVDIHDEQRGRREIYYPLDSIRKMTVIHENE